MIEHPDDLIEVGDQETADTPLYDVFSTDGDDVQLVFDCLFVRDGVLYLRFWTSMNRPDKHGNSYPVQVPWLGTKVVRTGMS